MQDVVVSLAVGFVAGFTLGYIACLLPSLMKPDSGECESPNEQPKLDAPPEIRPAEDRNTYTIKTKIAGVSFDNDDGTSRQSIILKYATDGHELVLVPDPNNEYDPDAVSVFLESPRKQLGHLNRVRAQEFMEYEGRCVAARITQVTGHDKDTLGVNIEIVYRR